MVTLQTDRVNSVGNIFVGLPANEYPVTTVTRGPRSGSLFRGRSHRASGLHRDHQTRCHGQEQHDETWNDRCPRFCRTQIIYPTDPLDARNNGANHLWMERIYRNVEERKRTEKQTTRARFWSLSTNRRRYREVVSLNCVERKCIAYLSSRERIFHEVKDKDWSVPVEKEFRKELHSIFRINCSLFLSLCQRFFSDRSACDTRRLSFPSSTRHIWNMKLRETQFYITVIVTRNFNANYDRSRTSGQRDRIINRILFSAISPIWIFH